MSRRNRARGSERKQHPETKNAAHPPVNAALEEKVRALAELKNQMANTLDDMAPVFVAGTLICAGFMWLSDNKLAAGACLLTTGLFIASRLSSNLDTKLKLTFAGITVFASGYTYLSLSPPPTPENFARASVRRANLG